MMTSHGALLVLLACASTSTSFNVRSSSTSQSYQGAAQVQSVGADGVVKGECSYVDAQGRSVKIKYTEGQGGQVRATSPQRFVSDPSGALAQCRSQVSQGQQQLQQELQQGQRDLQTALSEGQRELQQNLPGFLNLPFMDFVTPFINPQSQRQNEVYPSQGGTGAPTRTGGAFATAGPGGFASSGQGASASSGPGGFASAGPGGFASAGPGGFATSGQGAFASGPGAFASNGGGASIVSDGLGTSIVSVGGGDGGSSIVSVGGGAGTAESRVVGQDGVTRGECVYTDARGRQVKVRYAEFPNQTVDVDSNDPTIDARVALDTCRAKVEEQQLVVKQQLGQVARQQQQLQQQLFRQQQQFQEQMRQQQQAIFGSGQFPFNFYNPFNNF